MHWARGLGENDSLMLEELPHMSRFPTLTRQLSAPSRDFSCCLAVHSRQKESSIQIPISIKASDPSLLHASLRSPDCPDKMSASRKLLLFFILLFARAVSADGGDDFANNLFSDLGP